MEIDNIENFPLIAEGGQSRIYLVGSDRILRVPQKERDYDRIRYEFSVYRTIQDVVPVPRVHEVITYNGVPCLLMDRLSGCDLFSGIGRNILKVYAIPKKLAELHTCLLRIPGNETFETNHDKAKYCIEHSEVLSQETKEKLLRLLSTLDQGTTLCHGDFHPGNIMNSDGKNYIIDWSSATIGSPLFDIAHTYLLLVNTPRLKDISDKFYRLQMRATRYIAKRYVRMIFNENKKSINELFPYILVKAAERTFYGMDNEKKWLKAFIENTLDKKLIDIIRLEKYA